MFGIGGQELILLCLIGLIVLGPERLPRVANQIGNWMGQARRMTRVLKRQLEDELDIERNLGIAPSHDSRNPSQLPLPDPNYSLPREDDTYSPAHGEDEAGLEDKPLDETVDAAELSNIGDKDAENTEYSDEDKLASADEAEAALTATTTKTTQ